MRVVLYAVVTLVVGLFVVTKCVDVANGKDTTPLENVFTRPHTDVQKFVDKDNGVVCYWRNRTDNLFCVKVTSNRTTAQ